MSKTIYTLNDKTSVTQYDDTALSNRVKALEDKPDKDNQTLMFDSFSRELSISNGNSVTLPDYMENSTAYSTFPTYAKLQDEMTKNIKDKHVDLGLDKLIEDKLQNGRNPYVTQGDVPALSGSNLFVAKGDIPGDGNTTSVTVTKDKLVNAGNIKIGDTVVDNYWDNNIFNIGMFKVSSVDGNNVVLNGVNNILYRQPKQSLTLSGRTLSISEGNSVTLPENNQTLKLVGSILSISDGNIVNLSNFVTLESFNNLKSEYTKVKDALNSIIQNLKNSGAWNQTGSTIFDGNLNDGRNIATGNINVFSKRPDGDLFIRTNNDKSEGDLAGGVN